MRIDIVGSKPNPKFPTGDPDVVLLVNGAIAYADKFTDETQKIGFASLNFCSPNRKAETKFGRNIIVGKKLDKLMHWSPRKKNLLDTVEFSYDEETQLDLKTLRRLSYKYLPSFFLIKQSLKSPIKSYKWLSYLFNRRYFLPFSRPSSGMLAVAHCIETYPDCSEINVIGISVFDFSGHFYDKSHKSDNFHSLADSQMYQYLTNKMGSKIKFHDVSR